MSRGVQRCRLDDNHNDVAKALLAIGCSVQSLASVGLGVPDLLVAKWDVTVLLEIKDGSKSPSERELTKDEKRFHKGWKGLCFVVGPPRNGTGFARVHRAAQSPAAYAAEAREGDLYLRYLHDLPCVVCALLQASRSDVVQRYPTEAAHIGSRGLSQKCPDREAIPLCACEHHREGSNSAHVMGRRFWTFWGLDKEELIQRYNREYELWYSDRARTY